MNIFILIFCIIFTYLNYLVGIYYQAAFSLVGVYNSIFWSLHMVATFTMMITPFVYRLYPVRKPGFFYSALQWIGYILLGIYSVLFVFIIINVLGLSLYDYFVTTSTSKILQLSFLLAFFSLCVASIVAFVGLYNVRKKPIIKKVKIRLEHLPAEFIGLKILQMSDIHVGQTIRGDFVQTLVDMSNSLNPDIVVLTGDITDGLQSQLSDELLPLKGIKAPYGKFMVLGNHEYYWGVHDWIKHWNESDFTLLLNQHQVIEKSGSQIVIAGVHDYSAHRMSAKFKSSPKESLAGAPLGTVKILLAHQPRSIYEAHAAGFDLQLSGHTHSGQYFPYNILIYLFQPFVKGIGLYKKTWIYVNQGTGHWGRLVLGCHLK